MLKFLENYFINRKLSSTESSSKTLNIQKNLENPQRVVVLYNENLKAMKDVFAARETLAGKYPSAKVEFVFFRYNPLYRDIFPHESHSAGMPSPREFMELEAIRKIRGQKGIDMLFDMTTFDLRLRKIIVRTLKPGISISLFESGAEEDYNILLKNPKSNPLSLFSSLNFEVKDSPANERLSAMREKTKPPLFDIVIIGSSRKMKNEMKRAFKEQKKLLMIENPYEQLDFSSFLSIKNCADIKNDSLYDDDIAFIKGFRI